MSEESKSTPRRRRPWLRVTLTLLTVALIGVSVVEAMHWWRHVDEPDARVEVDFTLLSSSVNAIVKTVHVKRGDRVTGGDLLASMDVSVAELDPTAFQAEIARERALRDEIKAELAQYQREMRDRIATARAAIKLMLREQATLENRRQIAESHVKRSSKLASRRAITSRQMDEANDRLLSVTAEMRAIETEIVTERQRLLELENALAKEAVYESRVVAINRKIQKIEVQLRQSRERLARMHVRAPSDGIIDEIYLSPGVYVEDGDRAFLMHDPRALWLEAAIDESDIRLVEPGQKVRIEFDAYPFEYFEGEVMALGDATLGSMNGGGKGAPDPRLAQRVPVRIDLPEIDRAIRPGMRASINIVVR